MNLHAHDQAIAKCELMCESRCDGRAALLPRRRGAYKHKHSFVVNVEVALSRKAHRPAPGTGVAEVSQLVNALQQWLIGVRGCEIKLGVWRKPLVVSERTGTRERRSHDLHVLP